jgi:hypothetical protein
MNKILLGLLVGLFAVSAIACDGSGKKDKSKPAEAERSESL